MNFKIIGSIERRETFARGQGIRELRRLIRTHGQGNWRKRKGVATIQLEDGVHVKAEIHWYEANGVGKKEFKIKRLLD